MKTVTGTQYTYLPEERETHHRYDPIEKAWITWSNIPKDIERMKRQGWTLLHEDQYGAKFTAPPHALKIMPAEKKKRQLTEKQRASLAKNGFAARKHDTEISRDNNVVSAL